MDEVPVESVRTILVLIAAIPWAALVRDLNPHAVPRADLGADGELASRFARVAMNRGVGTQLGHHKDRFVGDRAPVQCLSQPVPDVPYLPWQSGIGPGEVWHGVPSLCASGTVMFTTTHLLVYR